MSYQTPANLAGDFGHNHRGDRRFANNQYLRAQGGGAANGNAAGMAPGMVGMASPQDGSGIHGQHLGVADINQVTNQLNNLSIPNMAIPYGAAPANGITGQENIAYPYPMPVQMAQVHDSGYTNAAYTAAQYQVPGYIPYSMLPITPGRVPTYPDRFDGSAYDIMPSLENRRGSYSTNESTPATPFFGNSDRGAGPRVVSGDRSSYTTPSPQQGVTTDNKTVIIVDAELEVLLKQEPAIPHAVPAVFTPVQQMKNLDQSLENRINGNRNVYIRGLPPTTDDELLLQYASRFGEVEQSKAIIDTATGACKGRVFGFAKFYDVRDSEKCIRGFYQLGYEVGFARAKLSNQESFNARLKAEGDETSTNLYISGIPLRFSEVELNAVFIGHVVMSSKILRDGMGNSRSVGFARFSSHDECEDIIRKYHGAPVGEEGNILQIRYADTPRQKELKRVTAERRQFRTNEYNLGAYGMAEVGIHPTIYNQGNTHRRGGNGGRARAIAPAVPGVATITQAVAHQARAQAARGPAQYGPGRGRGRGRGRRSY